MRNKKQRDASSWFLLRKFITMHGPHNVKKKRFLMSKKNYPHILINNFYLSLRPRLKASVSRKVNRKSTNVKYKLLEKDWGLSLESGRNLCIIVSVHFMERVGFIECFLCFLTNRMLLSISTTRNSST